MEICILGAGALGSVIGAALAEAGNEVCLVTRNRDHVAAIAHNGLVLCGDGAERRVAVRASCDTSALDPVDLMVVLVKSGQTRAAVAAARNIVGPQTTVLSLQNGLGHEAALQAILGSGPVIAGKTYVGGVLLAPGRVLAETKGRETVIGELEGPVSPRIRGIAEAFTQAGLETRTSENILGVMWDKLLVNVATGALSGITGLTYGDLYSIPEIEACALAAVAEAVAVARAAGVELTIAEPREAWEKARAGMHEAFKTSMLQSLEKNTPTEIDFINGAILSQGQALGVPTPVNATLIACIKGIEHRLGLTGQSRPA